MSLKTYIYSHRLVGKKIIATLARILPAAASRRLLALAEQVAFNVTPQYQGDTLPPIFEYWSKQFLTPDARRLGADSPESFYLRHIVEAAAQGALPVRVMSVGTGACNMEIQLAVQLKTAGIDARITCLDFNPGLMRRAESMARDNHVSDVMTFETQDCNRPFVRGLQDVIIVNQFFHHVTELEIFCISLSQSLAQDGALLSSDIVGRNGHLLWPDVEVEVQKAWNTLLAPKRYDRHFNAPQARYVPVNHAAYSNEGVRAQDVVACLLQTFDFELFFSFGAAIVPFIERRIGFNFDPDEEADRALIDAVGMIDAEALSNGRYPASNMIASMRHKGRVRHPVHEPVSPDQHVAMIRRQQAKI